ncbi:MAG: RidA family protein [Chloroflexi bacterium]|nr:RidA family protein [Chloroflexota bacterium]
MDLRIAATDRAPQAIGPYSQAIIAGDLVFCAGQVALDPAGNVIDGDVQVQTRRALDNLRAVLESAGSDLAHVTKTTVFLTDFGDFAAMNEVYAEAFGAHRPARSTVGVASLPRGRRVEIECIAVKR